MTCPDLKTWLTGAGIALTIVGGVLVWKFSPPHYTGIDGNVDDAKRHKQRVKRDNSLMSLGGLLLLVGAVAQLVANFMPAG